MNSSTKTSLFIQLCTEYRIESLGNNLFVSHSHQFVPDQDNGEIYDVISIFTARKFTHVVIDKIPTENKRLQNSTAERLQ